MKSLIADAVLTAVLIAPLASFAQSSGPITRAQVKAEVVRLENSGYPPAGSNDYNYPQYFLDAQSRISSGGQKDVAASSIGGSVNGASRSGLATASTNRGHSIYAGY